MLLDLFLVFWPVLLLLYAPRIAQLVAVTIANRTKSVLDHRIPDDMPLTAGEWLEQRLAVLGIGVGQVVTNKHDDAYRPHDKLIQLRDTTHFKADPVYWATAAHELGHAYHRAKRPWIGALRQYSQILCAVLVAIGIGAAFGEVLYGVGGGIAFASFVFAAFSRVFVLLDELCASLYAILELRDVPHRRAVIAVLVTAFVTYLVTYASFTLLLAHWPMITHVPLARYELTTLGWILVTVLVPASVAACTVKQGVLRWLPITLLLFLIWNVIDPSYAWLMIAAFAASTNVWQGMLHMLGAVPYTLVSRFVQRFEGTGVELSYPFLRARRVGAATTSAGNARIEALETRWRDNPPFAWRIAAYLQFGYLPLLVVIFL